MDSKLLAFVVMVSPRLVRSRDTGVSEYNSKCLLVQASGRYRSWRIAEALCVTNTGLFLSGLLLNPDLSKGRIQHCTCPEAGTAKF
ncbi:hypothetical protein K435DRAFT_778143, partial [Dendrothele bispora CBS 962.96]